MRTNIIIKEITAGKHNSSIRITVPQTIVDLMNIKEKDKLYWILTMKGEDIILELLTNKKKVEEYKEIVCNKTNEI